MRVISLFSGTGAFELGFERNGFHVVGQCEFDSHAQAVLKRHWPDVPLHGDITTLEGDAFGPAEVVVWGSPCQGLSLAGRRAGLKDERSGLFTEGIRFIRELREVTNGEYPRFSVWENVPGALSSNGGHDFRAVLEAFIEAEVPMPRSGKWANAGVVRGNGREVAWRVLDSQHLGVAQRRRRVFVVADFGGHRAAEVLFEREGVSGHPAKGRTAREEATRGARGGPESGSRAAPFDLAQITSPHNRSKVEFGAPANPLTASGFSDPCVALAFCENGRSEVRLEDGDGQRTGALSTGGGKPGQGYPAIAFAMRGRAEGSVPEVAGDVANALRGAAGGSSRDYVATYPIDDGRPIEKRQNGLGIGGPSDPSYTLDTTGAQSVAFAATDYSTGSFAETGASGPLTGTSDRSRAATLANSVTYGVRRLTPRECERLQGLPDGWTELGHYYEGFDRERLWNAKTRTRPKGEEAEAIVRKIADTHRYRLCGNAVTVNVAEWLGGRVAAALAAGDAA